MTKEQTREAIRIMQAWVDGKEVQQRIKKCDSRSDLKPDWWDPDSPWWDFDSYDYRIKPAATLRPWTADEVPLGAFIRPKEGSWRSLISAVDSDGRIIVHYLAIKREVALENHEHSLDGKTWLPCGVMEESK